MKSFIKKLSTIALFAFVISSPVFAANADICALDCAQATNYYGEGDASSYNNCYNDCMKPPAKKGPSHSQRYTDCSNSCYNAHKCIDACGVKNGKATKDGQKSCTDCRNIRTQCQNKCKE